MTEKEFAEIIGATKGIVLSAIEKNLPERFYHAIDDVAQETYIRAYRSLAKGKFRGDSKMSTWLYSIARNESLRMIKRLEREEKKFRKSLEKMNGDVDINSQEIDSLYGAIEKLPHTYREVMELVAGGFSTGQIAEKLDIKKGTVKSRSSRGREILHKLLREADL
ncbi:MAG: sigma-70 family RNA polymerase sigma factor [bacterium]|nr:sigma-70 family RNA polymerase sigma factor [bacterium]